MLARASLKGAQLAASWITATSRTLAATLRQWFSIAWIWARVQARMLWRVSLKDTQQASSWVAAKTRALAMVLQRNLSAGAAWSGANARAAGCASLAAVSAGYSRTALYARSLSSGFWHAPPRADINHRALVVRRCTALILIEPRRSRLPAIRAS
jgi:hypothetical protein